MWTCLHMHVCTWIALSAGPFLDFHTLFLTVPLVGLKLNKSARLKAAEISVSMFPLLGL